MEQVDAANAHRADCIAVIRASHRRKQVPVLRVGPFLLVVLIDDLQRGFDGGGAAVGVENPVEPLGGCLDKPGRQIDGRRRGEPEKRRVGDAVELIAHGSVDLGNAMSVDVAPQRGDSIEILPSFDVDQMESLAPFDDRRTFFAVRRHRCERVPDVIIVARA